MGEFFGITMVHSLAEHRQESMTFRGAKQPLRIHFIIPCISPEDRYGGYAAMGPRYPSLGVAQIAAIAELKGHTVRVTDAEANVRTRKNYGLEDIRKELEEFKPHIVGMPSLTMNIDLCHTIAKIVKEINPRTKVILGGAHASLDVKQALGPAEIDFGTQSEAEIVFDEFLNAIDEKRGFGHILGLSYKDQSGTLHINPPQKLHPDINQFPKPARHLFPMHTYNSAAILRGKRCLNMITSRGCPFRCSFCASPRIWGRSFRFLSTEKVMAEIRELMTDYRVDSIQFFDETFCVNKKRVIDLCDAMVGEKLNLKWSCFSRADVVDKELLQKMKDAGCYLIFFGMESGVQRLLDQIHKDVTLEQMRKAVQLCKEVGIQQWASYIFGLPSETEEESMQTIEFALELDTDYAQFAYFMPWPGTELYEVAKEHRQITTENLGNYTLFVDAVYAPRQDRGPDSVRRAVKLANRRFYLRPKYILKRSIDLLLHYPPEKIWQIMKAGFYTLR